MMGRLYQFHIPKLNIPENRTIKRANPNSDPGIVLNGFRITGSLFFALNPENCAKYLFLKVAVNTYINQKRRTLFLIHRTAIKPPAFMPQILGNRRPEWKHI